MRSLLIAAAAVLLLPSCASFDNSPDGRALAPHDDAYLAASAAHGPAARGPGGWVVSVTPQELAALGFGQQMELDVQAPGVVYVVDYHRISQLDGVFARTAGGLMPLRALLKEQHEAGRVVLRTRPAEVPSTQPVDDKECG